jgi:DNA invertase Pin-like site-specific DNA recombinase
MIPYFGYIRVSTARQGEGVSLEQQKSAIEAYARVHSISIANWFEEKESASKRGRRVFNDMLGELGKHRAAGVVIHKIDRSARHLADWVWVGELIDRGIDVRFAHENLDLTTRSGRLTGDMLAVIAADYSRNLRDEVKKGLYGRLKQGLYPFGAPVGYVDRGGGKTKSIDPVKGPLVRLAFELYASRRYSLAMLRLELHRRGLRQRTGRPLSLKGVSTLLNNPFYIGLMRINRTGQMFEGQHTPLVTKRLFDRVQVILRDRSNTKLVVHDFALRRLLRCHACGYGLTGERQKGHIYYRCHQTICHGVSIRELDALIELRWFHELIRFTDQDVRDMRDLVEESKDGAAASHAVEIARIKRALGLCDERLARLADAVIDGLIDKPTYEDRKAAALTERRGLLDELEHPPEGTQAERLLEKFELGNMAYLGVASEFPDEIREALHLTTSNLTVEGKYLVIRPRFPFDHVAKRRLLNFGGAYCTILRTDPVTDRETHHDAECRDGLRPEGTICRTDSTLALPSNQKTDGRALLGELSEDERLMSQVE